MDQNTENDLDVDEQPKIERTAETSRSEWTSGGRLFATTDRRVNSNSSYGSNSP